MKTMIDLRMEYAVADADPALLAITAAQTEGQTVLSSEIDALDTDLRWITGETGVGERVWAHVRTGRLSLHYRATVEITRPVVPLQTLRATSWDALPSEVLTYVRPSRYCPSDLFVAFVATEFAHLEGGAKIAAMAAWTGGALTYVPGSSTATTTAVDTFVTRQGVCRDYAHLLCSLARAANIPARYTTGYGPDVHPQDFHAVAEVWLDGNWHIVDPTEMSTAENLAIIGVGRDAGDVAFMETEKWASFVSQSIHVWKDMRGAPRAWAHPIRSDA